MNVANNFIVQPAKTADRWSMFRGAASPAVPYPAAPICYGHLGAGEEAGQLRAQVAELFSEADAATLLGWQRPEQATTKVALQGVKDADWSLDPDELKF